VNGKCSQALLGKEFSSQRKLDEFLIELDGTSQKKNLGANTILGISLAFAHAAASSERKPLYQFFNEAMGLIPTEMKLPTPLMNIVNGGVHADNGLEIQEFMIVPHGFASFADSLRAGTEIFQHLKKILHQKGLSTSVGDEGGFAPQIEGTEQTCDLICEAISAAKYQLGKQVSLALDVASSSFFNRESKKYQFRWRGLKELTSQQMIEVYATLKKQYPIVSIEDGLDENDWNGWRALTEALGSSTQLVGDDLFVTQKAYVERGIEEKVGNAILIKVNQVGSLTETFDTMALGRANGYRSIVSHRSGETEDTTIAHLAVGSGCGQIKTGSLSRGERTAKYNELLRIEEKSQEAGSPIPFYPAF
jgi:enolase